MPYSGKLSRKKTFAKWWKIQFSRRKLSRIARFYHAKGRHAPNFEEKTFVYSHKTTKFAKVFSLESFPLYGNTWLTLLYHVPYLFQYIISTERYHSDSHNTGHRTFPMVTKASATRLFLPPMVATIRSPSPQFSINVVNSTSVKKVWQNFHISRAPIQTIADLVLSA